MNKTWGRLARSWQRGPLRSGNGLRIIAHRGFRAAYPENTKSAFLLLPYIPPVVLGINIEQGRVDVEIPEGLDDEN